MPQSPISPERGAVLVEFAMIFPILIFLIAGIGNVGAILSQTQHMTTSVRYGARTASFLSVDSSVSCAVIKAKAATDATTDYSLRSPPPAQHWKVDPASTTTITSVDPAVVPAIKVIKVVGEAKNEDNCIFCTGNFLRRILPRIEMIVPLAKGCT